MAENNDFLKLENALLRAGREMTFPATPPIAARVRAELAASPRVLRNEPAERAQRQWWRVLAPLAAALILALALLFAFPSTREAIGQYLGLRGLQIFYVTPTPTPTVSPTVTVRPTEAAVVGTGATSTTRAVTAQPTATARPTATPTRREAGLCCEVTLAEAQRKARFKLVLPPDETPVKVYYQQIYDEGEQVVMVFGDAANPRFTLYQAQQWVYMKLLGKMLTGDTILSETQVKGERALWLSGAPHVLVVLDAQGNPNYETQRTVNANTLAWQTGNGEQDPIYRLETKGTLEQAVEFAESLVMAP